MVYDLGKLWSYNDSSILRADRTFLAASQCESNFLAVLDSRLQAILLCCY
eukprot:m.712221 g.712221  ORF g.712221 m.712221 type:complete len:50 (+) comp22959_c0_seq5:132-281(+)